MSGTESCHLFCEFELMHFINPVKDDREKKTENLPNPYTVPIRPLKEVSMPSKTSFYILKIGNNSKNNPFPNILVEDISIIT